MDPASSPDPAPRRGIRHTVLAIAGVALLVIAALLVGRFAGAAQATPGDSSVEAGFARDMQQHHLQAVEMSFLVRDRTDDESVRLLAYDIANAQSHQAGQMYGWLAEWGLTQASPEPSMTWMTRPTIDGSAHEHDGADHTPGEPMPGLATSEQIAELAAADGVEAERIFLRLMIAHHLGGVEMADAAIARTEKRVVVDLSTSIVNSQEKEILLMEELLAERG